MRIKHMILCLLTVILIGNMTMPADAAGKESPASFDLYNSYAPGEDILEEDNISTEDAPDFKESPIKRKPKISKKEQKSIQQICDYFSDYLGYSVGRQKSGEYVSLNFKKQKNRNIVLGFMPDLVHTSGFDDAAELIFGRKVSGTVTIYYVDWGDNKNIIKINKIEVKGRNNYEAKFHLVYYDSLKNTKTKFANGVFYLKKTGKNDFVVTKLKVKKTKNLNGM